MTSAFALLVRFSHVLYLLCEVAPIAGMIAFYNEKLDIFVDDTRLARPSTHFK